MSEGDKKDFYLVIPCVILDSFHRMELFGSSKKEKFCNKEWIEGQIN